MRVKLHGRTHIQTEIKPLIPLGPLTVAYGNKLTQSQEQMQIASQMHPQKETDNSNTQLIPCSEIILITQLNIEASATVSKYMRRGTDRDSG